MKVPILPFIIQTSQISNIQQEEMANASQKQTENERWLFKFVWYSIKPVKKYFLKIIIDLETFKKLS